MPLAFQMVNRDASQFNGLDEDTLTLHKEYIIDPDTVSYTHLTLPTTPYV